jgi:hypothetical protein
LTNGFISAATAAPPNALTPLTTTTPNNTPTQRPPIINRPSLL